MVSGHVIKYGLEIALESLKHDSSMRISSEFHFGCPRTSWDLIPPTGTGTLSLGRNVKLRATGPMIQLVWVKGGQPPGPSDNALMVVTIEQSKCYASGGHL